MKYIAPKTIEDALRVLTECAGRSHMLAGGTDMLVQIRSGRYKVDQLVDIKQIPELTAVSCSDSDGLTLGAAVPCYIVYEDPTIGRLYPGLVDSASLIGGIQIQSRATIGGNICNSSPSGDAIPMLIALRATCNVIGPDGYRNVPADKFCIGPGQNVLKNTEILVSITFPPPAKHSGAHYLRFIPRNEMDIAICGVGASVTLNDEGSSFEHARIALAAVGPTPILAEESSKVLIGKDCSDGSIAEAAKAAKDAAQPIDDMRGTMKQRAHLVEVLTRRALKKAVERALEATRNV